MMIVTAWVLHCLAVATVLAAGALAWEMGARWSGRPARWGWLAALAGSVAGPWLMQLVPERAWQEAVPAALPLVVLNPLTVSVQGASEQGLSPAQIALTVWLAASLAALTYVGALLARLARSRRQWRSAEVEGGRVFVARGVGPAAVGVRRVSVVLPDWALELETELRSLLLRHEREHVRAGDPRLLLAGVVLVAAMPWNPVVWVQLLRLRNAIELDCDARVLGAGADPERYGSLLLEVGRRRSSSALVMATFAEPRVFLEERIRRIARWPHERRHGRAAAFAVLAMTLFATALSARDPIRTAPVPGASENAAGADAIQAASAAESPVSGTVEAGQAGAGRALVAPADTPPPVRSVTPLARKKGLLNPEEVRRALIAAYPPLLKDGGIGGTTVLAVTIDPAGQVRETRVTQSSGYPALDEAARSAAGVMKFPPDPAIELREMAVRTTFGADLRIEVPAVERRLGESPSLAPYRKQPLPAVDGTKRPAPAAPRKVGPAGDGRPGPAARKADSAGVPKLVRPGARNVAPDGVPKVVPAGARKVAPGAVPPIRPPSEQPDTANVPRAPLRRPDPAAAPVFTPMTARPELRNREEVQRALIREYPPLLRDAGIGGMPVVSFYIDEDGVVARAQLSKSSGYPALDEAALRVASTMQFSPALNRERTVAVWVEIPLTFTAK